MSNRKKDDYVAIKYRPVIGAGFDIPRHHWQPLRLLIARGELGNIDYSSVPRRAYEAHKSRIGQLAKGQSRQFRLVNLKVWRKGKEVCFNCLREFKDSKSRTRHHLLPYKFRSLESYPLTVPSVYAHRQCTDLWHWEHDPHRPDIAIWSMEEYLAAAQPESFGFGLYYSEVEPVDLQEIEISLDLIPFIFGGAAFYNRPAMSQRDGDRVSITRLIRRTRHIRHLIKAQPPTWLRLLFCDSGSILTALRIPVYAGLNTSNHIGVHIIWDFLENYSVAKVGPPRRKWA